LIQINAALGEVLHRASVNKAEVHDAEPNHVY
jgi:hypothetical protein